jgi:beta-glucosidase
LDEHARRILRSEFASGIVDDPVEKSVVDVEAGFATARRIAEQSIVLLKNDGHVLPLDRARVRSVAIIGEHADMGMISGAGSAQVDPPGAKAPHWKDHVWFPTSPLKAVKAQLPKADVRFESGSNPATAAALAKQADVAIVFAHQWTSEEFDLPNLSLPGDQDSLIAQVAAANPRTIVVLESGSAVTMPWLDKVSGVLEAWYGGSKGADSVAAVLFGDVNPSARLPITFPRSESDMPRVQITMPPPQEKPENLVDPPPPNPTFSTKYDEGLRVGYKWYDAEKKPVLFPFGFGLSYTTFAYSDLRITTGSAITVSFTVKNTGQRAGADIAQVYASLPANTGEPPKRLVAWSKVRLNAGESEQVTLPVDPKYLSVYDEAQTGWRLVPGSYTIFVGRSSRDVLQQQEVTIP